MAGYGRALLSAPPCVSFQGMKIGRQAPTILPEPDDIRQRKRSVQPPDDRTYSAEVTAVRRNLLHHRIAHCRVSPHTRRDMIPPPKSNVKHFFRIFYKDSLSNSWIMEIFCCGHLSAVTGHPEHFLFSRKTPFPIIRFRCIIHLYHIVARPPGRYKEALYAHFPADPA